MRLFVLFGDALGNLEGFQLRDPTGPMVDEEYPLLGVIGVGESPTGGYQHHQKHRQKEQEVSHHPGVASHGSSAQIGGKIGSLPTDSSRSCSGGGKGES